MSPDEIAVKNFIDYLKIPSVHPDVNYDQCVEFLKGQARSLELPVNVYEVTPKKPIVIITWAGREPVLPSVLLNSHMDVVPVFQESWKYPPFSAHMDEQGNIYARGAQDMKCVAIQFLESVRRLKSAGVTLRRTLHLSFVPDEEVGGQDGMAKFVLTPEFRQLNVGFALDEGMATPGENYAVFNGERTIWHVNVLCPGQAGHGSLLLPNTAGEKLRVIIDRFMDFRAKEKKRLEDNPSLTVGDVTSVNLTMLHGGVQSNVVPEQLSVSFDVRIAPTVSVSELEGRVRGWCREAGQGVRLDFEQKDPQVDVTRLDNSNPYWLAFKAAADELGLELRAQIFAGGTDSRFVRELGIPAIGFSPMNNTPVLLHDHNEFLNRATFLRGVHIYQQIIRSVADTPDRTG